MPSRTSMAPRRRSSRGGGGVDGPALAEEELGLLSGRSRTSTPVRRPWSRNVRRSGTSKRARLPSRIFSIDGERPDCSTRVSDACGMLGRTPPHGIERRSSALSRRTSSASRGGDMTTFKELIRQVKSEIREVSVDEARALAGAGAVLVDVREADEWSQGHVPGAALHPPRLPRAADRGEGPGQGPRGRRLLRGRHAQRAGGAQSLQRARLHAASASMAGGFARWKEAGFPIVVPKTLTRRAEEALQPPPAGARGGRGRAGEAARVEGAARGRGRARLPRRPLPGRGRRGDASASWTPTWSTSSNLQRQVLHTTASVGRPQDRVRRGHASAPSTPT